MYEVKPMTTEEFEKDLEDFLDWAYREGHVLYAYCGELCSASGETLLHEDGKLSIFDLKDVTLGNETATTRRHVVNSNEV